MVAITTKGRSIFLSMAKMKTQANDGDLESYEQSSNPRAQRPSVLSTSCQYSVFTRCLAVGEISGILYGY